MFVPSSVLGRGNSPARQRADSHRRDRRGRPCAAAHRSDSEAGRVVAWPTAICSAPRTPPKSATRNGPSTRITARCSTARKLDAALIATPDHARTLPCIHAVQAGLDVYAEKPLTAYVREGRVLVDAVRKHDRVFQVGTQQRTMEINRFCCEFIRDGKIGKMKKVVRRQLSPDHAATKDCLKSRFRPATTGTCGAARPSCAHSTATAIRLDAMARLLGRRDDQLGGARRRSNSMGARQG